MRNGAKILLVEDDALTAEVLRRVLEKAGYSVELRKEGNEGLRAARSLKPALILLDFMLPNLDGLKVCKFLKCDAATRGIPVMMLSAAADQELQAAARSAGADDFLPKPVDMKLLMEHVRNLLKPSPLPEA
ncbi:MAG: response regulator [Planctomycetota bacterium]